MIIEAREIVFNEGYLENPLDPLDPLAPRPTTLDPRPSTLDLILKTGFVCLYNSNFCIIITFGKFI